MPFPIILISLHSPQNNCLWKGKPKNTPTGPWSPPDDDWRVPSWGNSLMSKANPSFAPPSLVRPMLPSCPFPEGTWPWMPEPGEVEKLLPSNEMPFGEPALTKFQASSSQRRVETETHVNVILVLVLQNSESERSIPRLIMASKSLEGLYVDDAIFTPCCSIEVADRPGPCPPIPLPLVKGPIFTRDPFRFCTSRPTPAFNALVRPPPPTRLPPPPPMPPTELAIRGPLAPNPEKDPRFPTVGAPRDPPGPDPPPPLLLLLKAWLPTTLIPERLVIGVCPWRPTCDNCYDPNNQKPWITWVYHSNTRSWCQVKSSGIRTYLKQQIQMRQNSSRAKEKDHGHQMA